MAEDQENKEDKFDFDLAGEAQGYISLDQARVLAIRHARDNTEFYGPRYSGTSLVWEVISLEEGEDYYDIKLSFRPAGRFRGEPGVEQFTIDNTGNIEIRQMLDEPTGMELPEPPGVTPVAEPPVRTQPPATPTRPPSSSSPAETPSTTAQPGPVTAPTSLPRPQAPVIPPREVPTRQPPVQPSRTGPPIRPLALVGVAIVAVVWSNRGEPGTPAEPIVVEKEVVREVPVEVVVEKEVVKEVPKEVIVEKEAVREVVVGATPTPRPLPAAISTPTRAPRATPTPVPRPQEAVPAAGMVQAAVLQTRTGRAYPSSAPPAALKPFARSASPRPCSCPTGKTTRSAKR